MSQTFDITSAWCRQKRKQRVCRKHNANRNGVCPTHAYIHACRSQYESCSLDVRHSICISFAKLKPPTQNPQKMVLCKSGSKPDLTKGNRFQTGLEPDWTGKPLFATENRLFAPDWNGLCGYMSVYVGIYTERRSGT